MMIWALLIIEVATLSGVLGFTHLEPSVQEVARLIFFFALFLLAVLLLAVLRRRPARDVTGPLES